MSKDFEWRTEGDGDWNEPPEPSPEHRLRKFPGWVRRHKLWVGGAALLFFIIVGLIYFSLDRRVEEANETITADVLAAHALVREAAGDKDFDLLDVLMVGGSTWRDLQLDLLNIGLFLDRRPLYLNLDSGAADGQPVTPTVSLSADLETAVLTDLIPYRGTSNRLISETIWLEHTFFYERQGESWLLTPLQEDDESFWGKWGTFEGSDYLTLIYPRRDEEVALSLGSRLDDLIGRICDREDVDCPPSFNLELRLSRDLSSMMRFSEGYRNMFLASNRSDLSLPTLTLVGRPVDEAGRDALYWGYENWLAAIMAYRYFERGEFFYNQQIEQLMADLGYELPPEPPTALPMPQPMPAPPIAFPEQDILMACSNSTTLSLLRYSPRANRWSDDLSGRYTTYLSSPVQQFARSIMAPLPDDSGVLISVNNLVDLASNNFKVVSWRRGEERLLLESDVMLQLLPHAIQQQFDPSGRNLVIFDIATGEEETVDPGVAPYAFNLQSCLDGNCDYQDYDGFPYWSPDSSWTLIVDHILQIGLTLRNQQTGEELFVGHGFSPYWLDEENFIYALSFGETETDPIYGPVADISMANVEEPLTHTVLLNTEDIGAALPIHEDTGPIIIKSVVSHPAQPDWLFIAASVGSFENYLLSFRRGTGEISVLLELEAHTLISPFQFMSGGQLLAFSTGGPRLEGFNTSNYLRLVPLEPETMSVVLSEISFEPLAGFSFDWSRDGRWLLIVEQDAIRLTAPNQNYNHTITHDVESCYNAAWVNQE